MFKSTQLCGNPSRNQLPQLNINESHIFFHNLTQIFRELRSRAREEFHVWKNVAKYGTLRKIQSLRNLVS
jgi:hypothetical protein